MSKLFKLVHKSIYFLDQSHFYYNDFISPRKGSPGETQINPKLSTFYRSNKRSDGLNIFIVLRPP